MKPVDFGEIVAALQARPLQVAQVYAPGGHVERGQYWALNPGRADRHIGSFHVGLAGAHAGRWRDHATGQGGDMLDLIQLARSCDRRAAIDEARRFLGLAEETQAQRALRRRHDERLAAERAAAAAAAEATAARKRASAHALWLRSAPELVGTPVADYLSARGVGLERLGRTPHAIRFHPDLAYRHVDLETGEIFEGRYPAMVTAIHGPHTATGATFWGAHRTWLARGRDGRWGKAPVPAPKKVLGSVLGGYVRLWSGLGPRGGKGTRLAAARPGEAVYVAEGVENGLSVAVLKPEVRVAAAVSLGNLREMVLPPGLDVVMVRDHDSDPKVRAQFDRARERWLVEGRAVGVWPERDADFCGAKDINAALMAAMAAEGAA